MKRQRGGTIVGFIVGVVFGLAAALAVAVYVTKVPVPFMNKAQSRTPEQDAAEAKKNRNWDPNAPLYGKNPARVASDAASAPAAIPTANASAARGEVRGEVKPAVSADPLGDLATAKSAETKPDPFTYYVQLGAYRTAEDAEAQRAKLSLAGIETKVTQREQSGRVVHRVRMGPFERRDEADRAKEQLDKAGYQTALVRVQR